MVPMPTSTAATSGATRPNSTAAAPSRLRTNLRMALPDQPHGAAGLDRLEAGGRAIDVEAGVAAPLHRGRDDLRAAVVAVEVAGVFHLLLGEVERAGQVRVGGAVELADAARAGRARAHEQQAFVGPARRSRQIDRRGAVEVGRRAVQHHEGDVGAVYNLVRVDLQRTAVDDVDAAADGAAEG